MFQQKSTRFSAAKVANFGVVMADVMGKMGEMEREIKGLRHHVSVLSKRNHQLVKVGKSRAASAIASDASLRACLAGTEYGSTVPFGNSFAYKNGCPSVLKRSETVTLYGGTERNLSRRTGP